MEPIYNFFGVNNNNNDYPARHRGNNIVKDTVVAFAASFFALYLSDATARSNPLLSAALKWIPGISAIAWIWRRFSPSIYNRRRDEPMDYVPPPPEPRNENRWYWLPRFRFPTFHYNYDYYNRRRYSMDPPVRPMPTPQPEPQPGPRHDRNADPFETHPGQRPFPGQTHPNMPPRQTHPDMPSRQTHPDMPPRQTHPDVRFQQQQRQQTNPNLHPLPEKRGPTHQPKAPDVPTRPGLNPLPRGRVS